METLNLVLGIAASVVSIVAAVISLSAKSDVKKMQDSFSGQYYERLRYW